MAGMILFSGCKPVTWTEAIRYGQVASDSDRECFNIEVRNGLVFVPVTINGESYRFLWDTGALFSISEEIQQRMNFKTVAAGNLTDSDNNRIRVDYVQVDQAVVGTVAFTGQTAFVGDFKANPILECLEIDGIIGSNLMRHGNWTIDQVKKQICFTKEIPASELKNVVSVPFESDRQFNMLVQVDVGSARVSNLITDYGSNGPISVSDKVFSVLEEHQIINRVLIEEGSKNSGLAGSAVDITRKSTLTDSVSIQGMRIPRLGIRTGTSGLLGNKVLSRFIVTIDWDRKQLHLKKLNTPLPSNKTYGFRMGLNREQGVIIQSVVKNSSSYARGIRPGMKVIKVDTLDFTRSNNFCDYVAFMNNAPDTLSVTLENAHGKVADYRVPKTPVSIEVE